MTIANAINSHESPVAASASDVHAPAAATAAVVSYAAAGSGISHCVGQVSWSYSATPTGGNIKIEDGSGNTVFSMDITDPGPGTITFKPPKKGTTNTLLKITLASGAGSVVGKLSANHWTE